MPSRRAVRKRCTVPLIRNIALGHHLENPYDRNSQHHDRPSEPSRPCIHQFQPILSFPQRPPHPYLPD